VSTPLEVEAPRATQMSGQPATEEDRRGERRLAWPMGVAVGRRPPPLTRPQLNGAGPEVEVAVVAMRGGGGGAATATGSAVVVLPSPRLSQVVVVDH
jgi:hypothetical protein